MIIGNSFYKCFSSSKNRYFLAQGNGGRWLVEKGGVRGVGISHKSALCDRR
jgi:hypothetical protein